MVNSAAFDPEAQQLIVDVENWSKQGVELAKRLPAMLAYYRQMAGNAQVRGDSFRMELNQAKHEADQLRSRLDEALRDNIALQERVGELSRECATMKRGQEQAQVPFEVESGLANLQKPRF